MLIKKLITYALTLLLLGAVTGTAAPSLIDNQGYSEDELNTCFADGDINGDGMALTVADLVYLTNFIEGAGPAPDSAWWGNMNGDGYIDARDIEIYQCYFTFGISCFPVYPVPTICNPDTVRGASCIGGNCLILSEVNCLDSGGTYFGDGTFCEDFECQSDTVTIFGLQHISLGAANLDTSGGALTVGNIGPSGEDGFTVDLGQSEGVHMGLQIPDTWSSTSFMEFPITGTVNGIPNQAVGTLRLEKDGDSVHIFTDWSPVGATSTTVEIWNSDSLVASESGVTGRVATFLHTSKGFVIILVIIIIIIILVLLSTDASIIVTLPDPTTILLGMGLAVGVGDEIRITPDNPAVEVSAISYVDINAADILDFLVTDEAIQMYGLGHEALGQATLEAASGNLTVGNIGPSGEDGVAIDLGGPVMSWTGSDFSSLPPVDSLVEGATLEFTGIGIVDSVPDQVVGVTTFRKIGGILEVTTDFSNVGSVNKIIELYNDGNLVAIIPDRTGPDLNLIYWPCDIDPWWLGWFFLPIHMIWDVLTFSSAVPIEVIGDSIYMADEVRIRAEDPISENTMASLVHIRATDFPSFTITDEHVMYGMLTIGEYHNEALDYFYANNPLTGNETYLTIADVRNVLGVLTDYVHSQGFDSSSAEQQGVAIVDWLTGFGLLIEIDGDTLYGYPVTSNEIVPYVFDQMAVGNDFFTDSLVSEIYYLNNLTINGTEAGIILNYVTNDFINKPWSPVEIYPVSIFADVYQNSYNYWTGGGRVTDATKIIVADALGALGGLGAGPVGSIILGAFFSIAVAEDLGVAFLDSVEYDGQNVLTLGNAKLDVTFDQLRVHRLDSSGNDGLSVHWEDDPEGNCPTCPTAFRSNWQPLDLTGALAPGSHIKFSATGKVNTIPGQNFGFLQVEKINGVEWDITADYPGSPTHRIEIWNLGQLVTVITGHTGSVARVLEPPGGCKKELLTILDTTRTWCYWLEWPDLINFEILGNFKSNSKASGRDSVFVGDELAVLSEELAGELDYLETFSYTLKDIPEIVFTSMSTSGAGCCIGIRGDFNGDGNDANILDLTYVVDRIFRGGNESICPEEADINGDGDPSNILDLTFIVDFIFRGGPPGGPCQ